MKGLVFKFNLKNFSKKSLLAFFLITILMAPSFAYSSAPETDQAIAIKSSLPEVMANALDIRLRMLHPNPDRLTPYLVPEDTSQKESVWLAATGDLMFHSPQVNAAYNNEMNTYDFTNAFTYVKPYLEAADLALGNFETTTAGAERGFSGYPAFNAPDETLDAIKWAGYDFLSTANNHCLDRGISGLERTIEQIRARDLIQSGTFKQSDKDALRYELLTVNNIKLGIISLTYGCNGLENSLSSETLDQAVNLIDENWLKETLTSLETSDVDATVVFVHWGNEYQREPSRYQKDLAMDMFSWGADIILGSHPHVIQKSEIVNVNGEDKYIIYSMGNFISNQSRNTLSNANRKYTENGVIVYLELTKDDSGTILTGVKHIPTWVYKHYSGSTLTYEIMPIEKQAMYETFPAISTYTEDAYLETMSMMANF